MPNTQMRLVFVLSLPRCGSTLTQRVLAAHEGVAGAGEPWILLPLLSPLQQRLPVADAWQRNVASAVGQFLDASSEGRALYDAKVRELALSLYEAASPPGTEVFVDKTPPYHLIVDEIVRVFPEARFVVLWRNPVAMLASIIETLCDGRWGVYEYRGDLFHGADNLVRAVEKHGSRLHTVRYEDLLDGESAWRSLCAFAGIDFEPQALERFAQVKFSGRMGDPTGVDRYDAVSLEPLTKWRDTINNPVRREWARRYLLWLGERRLATMGYDLGTLLDEVSQTPVSGEGTGEDLRQMGLAAAREAVKARIGDTRLLSSVRAVLSAHR